MNPNKLSSYNRNSLSWSQLLSLVHVWCLDHPYTTDTSVLIDIDGMGPQFITIKSTGYRNLSFESRAVLENLRERAGRDATYSIFLDNYNAEEVTN